MFELIIGIIAALFFAFTFILNHAMEIDGGSWLWSASLRYFFMVPFLVVIVFMRRGFKPLQYEVKKAPVAWLGWSFIGFGLFYAPLTFAAAYGPGWLVSGTWQFTIVAGVLLAPLFLNAKGLRASIPKTSLLISFLILIGIILIQIPHASATNFSTLLLGTLPVIVAAIAYPLGNRKMMDVCNGRLDTFERVLGMTVMSIPLWFILASWALFTSGLPSVSQTLNSLLVAVSSGIIATILFFIATDRVRNDQGRLAAVEATQSTEVLFVIFGEVLLLGIALPTPLAFGGIFIIIFGLSLHGLHSILLAKKRQSK